MWARICANISLLFIANPLALVIPGFLLVAVAIFASGEFIPHHWQGACYEAHLGARGQLGCVKHIPFANGPSTRHA
jgi:hypothetical protein